MPLLEIGKVRFVPILSGCYFLYLFLEERLGQSDPVNEYLLDTFGSVLLRPGGGWAVLAGTELPDVTRQGAEMRPPVVAMGGTERAVPLSISSGYRAGLSGKGLRGKGCPQRGDLMDREVRGGSGLCSDSSFSRLFL